MNNTTIPGFSQAAGGGTPDSRFYTTPGLGQMAPGFWSGQQFPFGMPNSNPQSNQVTGQTSPIFTPGASYSGNVSAPQSSTAIPAGQTTGIPASQTTPANTTQTVTNTPMPQPGTPDYNEWVYNRDRARGVIPAVYYTGDPREYDTRSMYEEMTRQNEEAAALRQSISARNQAQWDQQYANMTPEEQEAADLRMQGRKKSPLHDYFRDVLGYEDIGGPIVKSLENGKYVYYTAFGKFDADENGMPVGAPRKVGEW